MTSTKERDIHFKDIFIVRRWYIMPKVLNYVFIIWTFRTQIDL